MFDLSSLTYNSENPTFITILFTVLCSFFLSGLITFTYDKTSRQLPRPDYFLQALMLISIVSATVMQAIGDSLARGLGMLGALAIIRFRTTLRNPRNMVFMFSSIAAGIACGVYGFVIAFTGTIAFCLVAILLYFSPFSRDQNLTGTLYFELDKNEAAVKEMKRILRKYCHQISLKQYKVFTSEKKQHLVQYEYQIVLKKEMEGPALADQLKAVEGIQNIRLNFVELPENL